MRPLSIDCSKLSARASSSVLRFISRAARLAIASTFLTDSGSVKRVFCTQAASALIAAIACCLDSSLMSLLCCTMPCSQPEPIATYIGTCCWYCASNAVSCGSISAYSVVSASGAVSFAIVSANFWRSSSVIGSSFASLLQSALALANSAGGSECAIRPAMSPFFSKSADWRIVPSGVLVSWATFAVSVAVLSPHAATQTSRAAASVARAMGLNIGGSPGWIGRARTLAVGRVPDHCTAAPRAQKKTRRVGPRPGRIRQGRRRNFVVLWVWSVAAGACPKARARRGWGTV